MVHSIDKSKFTILKYGISLNEYGDWIVIEATKFDRNGLPILWGIRSSSLALSKFSGEFNCEPMPSLRDDEFFKEYRFSSVDEAIDYWNSLKKD